MPQAQANPLLSPVRRRGLRQPLRHRPEAVFFLCGRFFCPGRRGPGALSSAPNSGEPRLDTGRHSADARKRRGKMQPDHTEKGARHLRRISDRERPEGEACHAGKASVPWCDPLEQAFYCLDRIL
jgi:hypothetical protein